MNGTLQQGNHKLKSCAESREAIFEARTGDPVKLERAGKLLRFIDAKGRELGTLTSRHSIAKALDAGVSFLHCSVAWTYDAGGQYPDGLISIFAALGSSDDQYAQWCAREVWGTPRKQREVAEPKAYATNIVGESVFQDAIGIHDMRKGRRLRPGTSRNLRRTLDELEGTLRPVSRSAVENAIEALIGLLDAADGDPDVEDHEGGGNETDRLGRFLGDARAPDVDNDGDGDPAWTEWDTRGAHKLQHDGEPVRDAGGRTILEDEEDSDASEDDDPRRDMAGAEGPAFDRDMG